jgi:F-type H+-transporting ATPase subunit a
MAAENAGTHAPTSGEYIRHHLHHLQKDFSFQNVEQHGIVDFSLFNLWRAARKATSGVPGRFQAAVEILAEMVETQAKGVVHNPKSRKLVSPLALTVFVWIFLMNAMDMLPVDAIPTLWHAIGPDLGFNNYMRVVPTADLSTTLGLSLSVLIVCLVYNVRSRASVAGRTSSWQHPLATNGFCIRLIS